MQHIESFGDGVKAVFTEVQEGSKDAKDGIFELIADFRKTHSDSRCCRGCRVPYVAPRPIAYRLVACVPPHIKPQTQETVIAYQTSHPDTKEPVICQPVVENIEYTSAKRGVRDVLVEHFEYCKVSGKVSYNITNSSDRQYARLITLNNWYKTLLRSILFVTFSVMDLQANLMLSIDFVSNRELQENFPNTGPLFFSFWALMSVIALAAAFRESTWEWTVKSGPQVGDLISHCHRGDVWMTFFSMVAFRFFSVETQVKDIVTLLHPWKSVQPFAAIKCENARAYIVGYPNQSLFRVENLPGAKLTLPVQVFSKTVIFAWKVYFLIFYHSSWSLFAAAASSVFTVSWGWYKLKKYWDHRRVSKHWLMDTLQSATSSEAAKRAATKMLALHFKQEMDSSGKLKSITRGSYRSGAVAAVEGGPCTQCGRTLEAAAKAALAERNSQLHAVLPAHASPAHGLGAETDARGPAAAVEAPAAGSTAGEDQVGPSADVCVTTAGLCCWQGGVEQADKLHPVHVRVTGCQPSEQLSAGSAVPAEVNLTIPSSVWSTVCRDSGRSETTCALLFNCSRGSGSSWAASAASPPSSQSPANDCPSVVPVTAASLPRDAPGDVAITVPLPGEIPDVDVSQAGACSDGDRMAAVPSADLADDVRARSKS